MIARRRWIQPIPESPRGSGTTGCLAIYAKWYVAPLGAPQPRSTLYLTRAQPWRAEGVEGSSVPPPVFFLVACARRKVDFGTEKALRTLRTRFIYIRRVNVRTNGHLPIQMFQILSSFEIRAASQIT